jgi:hypothetical protein
MYAGIGRGGAAIAPLALIFYVLLLPFWVLWAAFVILGAVIRTAYALGCWYAQYRSDLAEARNEPELPGNLPMPPTSPVIRKF